MTTYGIGEFQMRNGGKAVVNRDDGDGRWPLEGFVKGKDGYRREMSWSTNGLEFDGELSRYDLISPWVEPSPAVTAEDEIATLKAELAAAKAEISELGRALTIHEAAAIIEKENITALKAKNERLRKALEPFGGSEPPTYETEYGGRTYIHCVGCHTQVSEGQSHDECCDWLVAKEALKGGAS